MIVVLALDRSNGWVFGRDGERILLMRPPYRAAQAVPEAVVGRALVHDGYEASDRELPTWADVVDFVRGEVEAQRKAEGRALPAEGTGRALLKTAPATMIERLLERVESDLLPRNAFEAAESMLLAIQAESARLEESPGLARRSAALLNEVRTLRRHGVENGSPPRP